jgi:putative transposase
MTPRAGSRILPIRATARSQTFSSKTPQAADLWGNAARSTLADDPAVARPRRCYLPGLSFHVYNRGNNRSIVFRDDRDYRMFLAMTKHSIADNCVAVHAVVLMTNHFHMLVTPDAEHALPLAMKQIGERYSRYFNDKYGRTGALWEGRYQARPIENSSDVLICLRYIEQNPVKAGIVAAAEAYPWSSFAVHALGRRSDWLVPHSSYERLGCTARDRQLAYRVLCDEPLPADAIALARHKR